jgi:hypothetical protein
MVDRITERTTVPLVFVGSLVVVIVGCTSYVTSVSARAAYAEATAIAASSQVAKFADDTQKLAERIASLEGKINLLLLKEARK